MPVEYFLKEDETDFDKYESKKEIEMLQLKNEILELKLKINEIEKIIKELKK